MITRNIYKCFISSPGDCEEERKTCEAVINEINKGLAKHLNINFETFKWESDVLPDMGKNGQEIIDQHIIDSKYDVFIGIMKNRYGQPTKKAGSGTEHEFNDALKRKEGNNEALQILFFFGKEMVDPDKFDKDQYDKVKEFKNKVRNLGIYTDFNDISDFERLIKNQLELFIKQKCPSENIGEKVEQVDKILKRLELELEESLKSYNEKSPVWIEPIISSRKEIPNNPTNNETYKVDIKSIIETPSNIIIKAPSEFGLTSLAHYIKLEGWKIGKTFLYIDAKKTKKHKIIKDINQLFENDYSEEGRIDCILLDSICIEENGIMQMIKNVCEEFQKIPIIIFNTIDNNFFLKSNEDDKVEIKRQFQPLYLLPLSQNEVRKIVVNYSRQKSLEENDDIILNKVTKDLEVLNLHRTPKNCISILRASSRIGTNYNPVNRTKLLDTILNTIFEEYEIPTYYDKKPDVKDCSFVLGYLCEVLVSRNDFEFSEDFFKSTLKKFCEDNFIELDLAYLLKVLIDNSIIGKNYNLYYFKNSYWVFYFLAHRMNMSNIFLQKIYTDKKYIDFPEIIEFYTGIDRNKADALEILTKDIEDTLLTVRNKVKIPDTINPFKSISWNPNVEAMEKEEAKFSENVILSGLPDEVKDRYDDKNYNQNRPYNQVINSVIRDYSFLVLMRQISAASRALRNSDYVISKTKTELLDKIMLSWNEINKLLIVLSPLLADKGDVAFEGARFHLSEEDFDIQDPDLKRLTVLLAIPTNVVKFFKDDLFSSKMGPLIINKAKTEVNSLIKHELMLLLVAERPQKWRDTIDDYIVSLDKNSFFLSDILSTLNFNIDYKATEQEEMQNLKFLAKKCRAKHILKENNPSLGLMNRLDKLDRGSKY